MNAQEEVTSANGRGAKVLPMSRTSGGHRSRPAVATPGAQPPVVRAQALRGVFVGVDFDERFVG
jgi:hypothetical protein